MKVQQSIKKLEYISPESFEECISARRIILTSTQNENYDNSVFDWGEAGYDSED